MFAYEKDFSQQKKEVAASFNPDETDHLIKGLLFQFAKGLGRTSTAQLIAILEYCFSDEFKKENARMNAEFEARYGKQEKA